MEGIIIKNISNDYVVKIDDCLYTCKPRGKFRQNKITPLVGDVVDIDVENTYVTYKIGDGQYQKVFGIF